MNYSKNNKQNFSFLSNFKSTFFLFFGLLLFTCNQNNEETIILKECENYALHQGTISDIEEYEIIEAVIEAYLSGRSGNPFVHVIDKTNKLLGDALGIKDYLEINQFSIESEVIDHYVLINDNLNYWDQQLLNTSLISHLELDCFFLNNRYGTESYLAKYPDSIGQLEFSRPGISNDGRAFVEFWHSAGQGVLATLVLEEGVWIVQNLITTVIT